MLAHFDFQKTLQASAYLLKKANAPMKYIKLLKLLYMADKEMLLQYGTVITCDQFCAMPHGPVLSKTYDLIKGVLLPESSAWNSYIKRTANYMVELIADPGIEDLSEADTDALDHVYEEFGNLDSNQIEQHTHEFPEWKNRPGAQNSSIPFTPVDVLRENGKKQLIPVYLEHLNIARALEWLNS